ncbi:MAG: polysaccharide biosynthesis protein [Prevotella sp.]
MKKFLAFNIVIGGAILISHLVNYLIVVPCVIGNGCDYDTGKCDRGKVFELLFEQSSDTGYHPEPTLFNFFFVTLVGTMVVTVLLAHVICRVQATVDSKA